MSEVRAIVPCEHGASGECHVYLTGLQDGVPVSANQSPWKRCPGGWAIRLRPLNNKMYEVIDDD